MTSNNLTPFVPTPDQASGADLRQALLLRDFTEQLFTLILQGGFNQHTCISVAIPGGTTSEVIYAVKATLIERLWNVCMGTVGMDWSVRSALVISPPTPASHRVAVPKR